MLLYSGNWYLLGVPFLIKTRRMLDGMDTGEDSVQASETDKWLFLSSSLVDCSAIPMCVMARE